MILSQDIGDKKGKYMTEPRFHFDRINNKSIQSGGWYNLYTF